MQDALDRNALVEDDSDVHVDTSGNTATLRGSRPASGGVLAGRAKFGPELLGEAPHAEGVEHLAGDAELVAGVAATALAA